MTLIQKPQYLLSVIEQTKRLSPITSKCNKIVDFFDTQQSAFDWVKKNGSELEKYAVTEAIIVIYEK